MSHSLEEARKHVKHVRDFFYHLMTYLFVATLLVIVDRRGGVGEQAILGLDWAYWVILFWGLGVLGHAISVFLGDHRAAVRPTREIALLMRSPRPWAVTPTP